jgi:general stress protein 26
MPTPTDKLDELYGLIEQIETATMTTRRPDGHLVSRPMATQKRDPIADLWFVTSIETHKVDEIAADPHLSLGYFDPGTYEWVAVSGTATLSQDRAEIRRLYQPDWKAWFGDEGGARDGGPDDPRLALILVDIHEADYMKAKHSKPVALFHIAKGMVTGEEPDLGREEHVGPGETPS